MKNKALCVQKKKGQLFKKTDRQLFLLCFPAIIKVFVFSFVPMLWFLIAFENFIPRRGIFGSPWTGFENLRILWQSELPKLLGNAIILQLGNMIFPLIVSLLLGLLLFEITSKVKQKIFQTIMFFPYFISWSLVGAIVSSVIGDKGLLTGIIEKMTGERVAFYEMPQYWRFILVFMNVWKSAGVSAVLYYAILIGSDKSVYEAADLDGANRWKKILYISLPQLKLMIMLGIIMGSANLIRTDFSWIYYVSNNRSELYEVTETIEVFMFNALRKDNNYCIGTAVGLFQSVIGLVLTVGANFISKKISPESTLF